MVKTLSGFVIAILLYGCTAVVTPLDEEYQLGDTSQSLVALRGEYCEEVTPLARLGLRKLILELGGTIPQDFCQ